MDEMAQLHRTPSFLFCSPAATMTSRRAEMPPQKLSRSFTIALSDMQQLMRSARSARIPRAPGCCCSCHLLQDVAVSPPGALFTTQGGISTHNLSNASTATLAVKITCSDNSLYRVNPVFAILEPGRCISLHIGRVSGPPKRDRLCILLLEHTGSGTAKDTFKQSDMRPASICVPLSVSDE